MKHYNAVQWLQFLRAQIDSAARAAMRSHLDSPCRKCSSTLELLRKVESAAQADSRMQVPENAVRMARAIFALHQPERVQVSSRILARMVFDSFRQPAAVGVRSGRQLARQTLYEAGDYTIDLRLEPDVDPTQVVMVGQIANRLHPDEPAVSVPIVLRGGQQEVGRAVTNQFGEFQLVYRPRMPLRLLIPLARRPDHVEIVIPRANKKGRRRTSH
jgi:hypothetical protein